MQHIVVKTFAMEFDFGFRYKHFYETVLVTGFPRLHKIIQIKRVKLAYEPVHGLTFFKYLHWRVRWYLSAYDYVY